MSEKMTKITLPGCESAGLLDWGELSPDEMIRQLRAYHQRNLDVAKEVLAALDADFRVEIVRGPYVQHKVSVLQDGKSA